MTKLQKVVFRLSIGVVVSLSLLVVSSSSCVGKKDRQEGKLRLDTLYEERSVSLFVDRTDPALNVSIEYIFPTNNDSLLSRINELLLGEYTNQTGFAIERYIAFLAQDYSVWDEEVDSLHSSEMVRSHNVRLNNDIIYEDEDIFSMEACRRVTDAWSKDVQQQSFYCINLKNNYKKIVESDLFVDGYQERLSQIILNNMLSDFGVQRAEQLSSTAFLNPDDIAPNDNFSIDNEGITYCFNEYGTSAEAHGPVYVFIPYEQIVGLIKPGAVVTKFFSR
ncbi:MAG: RsiV family protein [Porphyromonas sp.]|nr:RsiV family protein [Porphyromonas sp.]